MLTFLHPFEQTFPRFNLIFAFHVHDLATEQTGVIHAYVVSEDFLLEIIPAQKINVEHLVPQSVRVSKEGYVIKRVPLW